MMANQKVSQDDAKKIESDWTPWQSFYNTLINPELTTQH